jgi:hypothetical protein
MGVPTTREEFKDYCLRRLGDPVIKINVEEEQVEDRIDEALEFWHEYDFDGVEKLYRKHEVTSTDITNGYISLPTDFIGVTRIYPITGNKVTGNIFSAKYQFYLNQVPFLFGGSGPPLAMSTYYTTRSYLNMVDFLLEGEKSVRFVRHKNILRLDLDASEVLSAGDWLLIESYRKIDVSENSSVWTDIFLQRYTTQLIKRQWGINLKKFDGVQMPGGTTFNGQQIYDEAVQEIAKLEDEMQDKWSRPVDFFVG